MAELPVLYSFRRCPYAIRARLALACAGQRVELREIVLKDKAPEFVDVSPKATVPVLVAGDSVLEESLDIMSWALVRHDPEGWLDMPEAGHALITENYGDFKAALDRTKYDNRYNSDPEQERAWANVFLRRLAEVADGSSWLFYDRPTLADMALLPFIRQFAFIDRPRFDREQPPWIRQWLDGFLNSELFAQVMPKYPRWSAGDPITVFPSWTSSDSG